MPDAVTFLRMPRSKPKTIAEGREQLSSSLARMASGPILSKRVPITEVGFAQCRFVVDDRTFPALCCGEATLGGSWCAQHRALVFVRVAAPGNGRRAAQAAVATSQNGGENVAAAPQQPAMIAKSRDPAPRVDSPVSAAKQKRQQDLTVPSRQAGQKPAAVKQPSTPAVVKDNGTARRGNGAGKKAAAAAPKSDAKQPPAVTAKSNPRAVPAGKPAASRPTTLKKVPGAGKKAEAGRTSRAANPSASAGKSHAAKPAAKKVAPARKGSATKHTAPVKKPVAARRVAGKKGTPARKSKARKRAG